MPQEGYDIQMKKIGALSKDTKLGETAMRDIDGIAERITNNYKKVAVNKIDKIAVKDDILNKMNDVLMSGTSERILNKDGKFLYQAYKKASFDPISKKAKYRYKTEDEFMKDLMAGKSQPVLFASKKGPVIKSTLTDGAFNTKNLTTLTNPKGKLKPIFGMVDEIAEDTTTGKPFRTGSGVLDKLKPGSLLPRTAKLPDKLIKGKFNTVNTKTGKDLYDVQIDRMDPKKVAALRKLLRTKYKADPEDIKDLLSSFVTARSKWGELFTSMGRRFNPEALEQFEKMLPKYINDVLDRGYDVFKNNKNQWTVANNYRPTKEVIKEAVKDFKESSCFKR